MRSYDAVCSISGGSDSDIVLDLIHKVDEDGKVKYVWIDTGLDYTATKEHLDFLEQKYGITIERVKPDKPIPINTYQGSDKSRTVMAGYHKYGEATVIKNSGFNGGTTAVAMPVGAAQRGRYVDSEKTEQHIEVREDGKSNCLTTVQKDSLVCTPVRIGHYGKGGQGQRIYSVVGKSVTLSANGGGQGAKTGLYKIDLPDGDYVIRKLTPIEAERLQTLPDNYTAGISNTQRYKCIGNGWTVDVIAHILGGLHDA